jgi:glycosyltransferase involved in cell wall biosynthesis
VDGNNCERCVGGNTAHAVIHRCIRDSYFVSAWYALILGIHRVGGTFSKSISRFVVPDVFMLEMLSHGGFSRERIHVNSNPVDISNYDPSEEFDDYVLFVGRFVPQKGAMVLVEAMNQVRAPIRALLVGFGPQRAALEVAAARTNNKVRIVGRAFGDEKKRLIARALAVVIPSTWHDNIPAVLTEAFATGKPVIASDILGLREEVSDGRDGLLFRTGDAADLAAKIDFLASNPALAKQMGKMARAKAVTEWNETAYYHRLRAVLDLAVSGG